MKRLLRLAFAVFVASVTSALIAPSWAAAQALDVPAGCKIEDGRALLTDFLAADDDPLALQRALQRDDSEVEFLLATVPEPRLGFDGVVEAIATALESAGHTLDRYALPWTQRPDKGTARCQEYLPGVALFIKPPEAQKAGHGPRRLLLVYLIGESPTEGVYPLAFLRAAAEMATLRGQLPADRCRNCESARLLGPSFSGAVTSLEQVLEHPAIRNLPFTIVSGRATDASIRPILEAHARPDRPISFRATLIPDEALQTEFFCYLTETLGADDHDIALLTESSTVFGQAASLPPGSAASWREQPRSPKSARCKQTHHPRLTLPVPLHISRLNAAWSARQTQTKTAPPPDPLDIDQGMTRALPKILDNSERTDVMPTLSPGTVVSTDRALATILTTIAAEGVRYVGLIFTDPQDTLFLAEQVRKYCPDVVLFTFESNILYTHPDARPVLKGMLSVSTYPLFTRNQQWSFPFRGYMHRIQFGRDADQGVYNAALALLGRPDQLLEYSQPVSTGDPKPQDRPPVWINAVGIEALIPLIFITNYDDRDYLYRNPQPTGGHQMYAPYQQGTLNILLLILGITGVVLAAGYFRCYYASPTAELHYPWALFRLFRRFASDSPAAKLGPLEASRQPYFALTIFLPMALIYPFFTTVHFMQLRDGHNNGASGLSLTDLPRWLQMLQHSGHIGVYEGLTWRVLAIGLCAAMCQLVFMITSADLLLQCVGWGEGLRQRIRTFWQKRPRLSIGLFGVLLFSGTFVLFWTYVHIINVVQRDFNNLVFMRRTAHPAFGLSPLYPMLILISALQLWGYCNLQRIRLLEKLATVFIDFIEELEHETRLRPQLELITQRLESPSFWQFAAACLTAVMIGMSLFAEVVSLEHYSLNFFFRLLFAMLCVCVCYAAYRFLRLWLHFGRFLDLIAQHPLAHALERMPETLSRSIGSMFLEELPEQARYEAEQSHARLLYNHLRQIDLEAQLKLVSPGDAEALRPMFAELTDLLALRIRAGKTALSLSGLPEPSHAELKEAHDGMQFDQVSRLLVRILKIFWRARPVGAGLPDGNSLPLNQPTAVLYARALPAGLSLWLRLAEDLIAVQVVAYIHRLFPHLRNTLVFFTGALLLMLLAIVTYPFQPQHFLGLVLWTLILGGVGLTFMVFVQMNRNETLSRLSKTEPGKVSFDRRFLSQVVIYGVLPLLSLLAAQFPEVRGVAFSWFETILKTLK